MSAFEVYVLFQLDFIGGMVSAISLIFGAVTGVLGFVIIMSTVNEDEETIKKLAPIATKSFIVFIAVIAIGAFIPSTKTAAAMYVIPAIVNNEKAQQLPDKLLDLVNEKLDELMKNKDDHTENQ